MSFDQILSAALRLPPEHRALLAESLWESLEDPFVLVGEGKTAGALAQERDRQIEAGEVKTISHADMMTRLRR